MTKIEWERFLDCFEDDEEITERDIRDYERELCESREERINDLEERQMDSGFYAFQDEMYNFRHER